MVCNECYNKLLEVKCTHYKWSDCWIISEDTDLVLEILQNLTFTTLAFWLVSFHILGEGRRSSFDNITPFMVKLKHLASMGLLVNFIKSCKSNHFSFCSLSLGL